jgi:hypothetical protein
MPHYRDLVHLKQLRVLTQAAFLLSMPVEFRLPWEAFMSEPRSKRLLASMTPAEPSVIHSMYGEKRRQHA